MPAVFVHISDIHFGQERDERLHIHTDVKDQVIADAAQVVAALPSGVAHGILVTGDIAFAGVPGEYQEAGVWLDRLAAAVGCERFRIQMVPGNHDLDRTKMSYGASQVLNLIRAGGATEYEKMMANTLDRGSLFARFEAYGRFCEGYDCPLDVEGRFATNIVVTLAPGRTIRFIRWNSALLCTGEENDEQPELMIGARQFVVPRAAGEETVVLIHHPLHWCKDSKDAATYLKSRARVLISGHEHNPDVRIEAVDDETELMILAAGATVPSKSNEVYNFSYNVLVFDWDQATDRLAVTVHPRAWDPVKTAFKADSSRLKADSRRYVLKSPNFANGKPVPCDVMTSDDSGGAASAPSIEIAPALDANGTEIAAVDSKGERVMPPPVAAGYPAILLRFFRDLREGERLKVLTDLGAIQELSDQRINQALERKLLDWLVNQGRLEQIREMIDQMIESRRAGGEKQ
jgi:hypothetical protein